MDFNVIIHTTFAELLGSLAFIKTEDRKKEVTFESDMVTLNFIYHSYSFEYYYFIGLKRENITYENFMVEDYLSIKRDVNGMGKTQQEKTESIISKQLDYFKIHQHTLLKGDDLFYAGLNEYSEKRTREYNNRFTI